MSPKALVFHTVAVRQHGQVTVNQAVRLVMVMQGCAWRLRFQSAARADNTKIAVRHPVISFGPGAQTPVCARRASDINGKKAVRKISVGASLLLGAGDVTSLKEFEQQHATQSCGALRPSFRHMARKYATFSNRDYW